MRYLVTTTAAVALLAANALAIAQATPRGRGAVRVIVAQRGVLRWSDTGDEVALFGVNYYAPFSLDYHALQAAGVAIEREIDRDIGHLKRLGLDLIRIHVFDREISDADGSILANDHLRLCDYLVHRCKQSGIYVMLTPIAWWPTPNASPGFSSRYSIRQMTSDAGALAAQRRYLAQLMAHVNPYTGIAYGVEPAIAAIELINEPVYGDGVTDEHVVRYIDALADAVRGSGCRKPVFYNGWEGRRGAVRDARVDGCTFNWYPTGLMNGHELRWNTLKLLDRHPDMHDAVLNGKAKAVYEYDPADVPLTCMYPAMARAFRAGGAQMAAQFQYDPAAVAWFNPGWQTHHLNLCCTPGKAISLMIAAEAFRRIPRGREYGAYPGNRRFGSFEVSYERNLSVMATSDRYYYSSATTARPPSAATLTRVAGCGSSPVVGYGGSGAYFLDRIGPGAWRLEVYPDAVPARDAFARPFAGREVVRLVHRPRRMAVRLPDLGASFTVVADGRGAAAARRARAGVFTVRPGVYRLLRAGTRGGLAWPNGTFWAPAGRDAPAAWHTPPRQWRANTPLRVEASIVGPGEPRAVSLVVSGPGTSGHARTLPMRSAGPCRYSAKIPARLLVPGELRYRVHVTRARDRLRYPGGFDADRAAPVHGLFRAAAGDMPPPGFGGGAAGPTAVAAPGPSTGSAALRLEAAALDEAEAWTGITFAATSPKRIPGEQAVTACLRALHETPAAQIVLTERGAAAFAADVGLTRGWRVVAIPLYKFLAVDRRGAGRTVDTRRLASVAINLLGRLAARPGPQGVEVAWLRLGPLQTEWRVPIVAPAAPVALFDASRDRAWSGNPVVHSERVVPGAGGQTTALQLAARSLGLVVGFRRDCTDATAPRDRDLGAMAHLRVRARWAEPIACAVQVVLCEQDGTPWGADVNLTDRWRDISVPLASMRYLKEWRAGPPGRGGAGDRLRAGRLASVVVSFGAWLDPARAGQAHTLELEEVALEP